MAAPIRIPLPRPSDSALTLAAIATLAYISCDLLHELVGHGCACLATGGQPATFSTVHFQCLGGWQPGACAAGIVFNVIAGAALWLAARRSANIAIHVRYFVWLAMAYNLFTGWGYVVSSSLGNSGDLANAFRAAPPAIPRSLGWIVAAVLAAAVFVGAVGPGLRLRLVSTSRNSQSRQRAGVSGCQEASIATSGGSGGISHLASRARPLAIDCRFFPIASP
jgi:hypothetical protein